uniref:endo-polygalacturonase n=1 Tax=Apolygus lucorum TaxID=248454 RepID=A0A060D3P1_APOLU|nr:polygalacturonase PG5-2 [Apolygus lucorum]
MKTNEAFKRWLLLSAVIAIASAVDITDIKQLDAAKKGNDRRIVLQDIHVPAGSTLNLENLKPHTTVIVNGKITFGYKEWRGPLIKISGRNIKVEGTKGSLIDGDGARWWDGRGGNGGKVKPKLITLRLTDSEVSNLNFKNSPAHGVAVFKCRNVKIHHITFDDKDGHTKGGHNTDAFDVGNSDRVTISDCYVDNQDDCLAVNSGTRIVFEKNTCIGGHGISIGSIGGRSNNVVDDVLVKDCKVINNDNGIRIKTKSDATGLVKNVKFINVELENIKNIGISILGNYANGGPSGQLTPGIPIQDLVIDNVHGTVQPQGVNIKVWVVDAARWTWKSNVTGGKKTDWCQGIPSGVNIACGV